MKVSPLKHKKSDEEATAEFATDYASLLDHSRSIVDDVYREYYRESTKPRVTRSFAEDLGAEMARRHQ